MKAYIALLMFVLLFLGACDIEKPSLPVWDVDIAVPLLNDIYYVSDLVDSVNIMIGDDEVLYLTGSGEVDTPAMGEVELNPEIDESDMPVPSGANTDFQIPFYDSVDNAVLSYGELSSGTMRIRFANVVPQTEEIRLIISDITDSSGNALSIEYDGNQDWRSINLAGYHFGDIESTEALSELEVSLISTSSLPDGSPLAELSIQMNEALSFAVFKGHLNHFEIGLNESSSSIDIEYPSDVDQAITLHEASLQIDVINHMGFSCVFEGRFEARRGDEMRSIPIVDENGENYVISAAEGDTPGQSSLIFENNISQLMQIMPQQIQIVDARFVVNSESGSGTLRNTDVINAHYIIDAPFRFTLHEHPILVEDAVEINIGAENRDYIANDLQAASLTLEVMNKIPVGGTVRAFFADSLKIDPQDPETYAFYKELVLHSAETAPDWQTIQGLSLDKDELNLFAGEKVYVKWEFSFEESLDLVEISAGSGDFVAIRGMLRGKLRINPEEY